MGNYDDASPDELGKTINKFKWAVFIMNVVGLIAALATFGVCIWIRFDLDFEEWVREINWYSYWYCVYCIMIAMVVTIALSVLGVLASVGERTGLLLVFTIMIGIMILWHFVGAIVIGVWGVEESKVLVNELGRTFLKLIYEWDTNPRSSRILRQIQEYVGCCGAIGSEDYINAHKPVPVECRDMTTGSEYKYGCQQQFAWWLEPWSGFLAGISCFFMVLNAVAIWSSSRLRRALLVEKRNY